MHIQILEHPDLAKYDLSSLMTFSSGGAPAPVSFAKAVKEKFALKQGGNGWGMSETLTGVTGIGGEDYLRKPNSIGIPLPNHDIKYVDENDNEVKTGESGEVVCGCAFHQRGDVSNGCEAI